MPVVSDEFQSTGLCGDRCTGSYAFAVIQGNRCWCSNYVPADQVDTSDCNQGCPGISTEWCGNTDEGLYGYFQLPLGNPIGTSGGSSSPTATRTSSSVSTVRSSFSSSSSSSISWSPSTPLVTVAPSQSSERTSSSSRTPSYVYSNTVTEKSV